MIISSLKQYIDDIVKIHITNIKDIFVKDRNLLDNLLNIEIPAIWDAINKVINEIFPTFKQQILDMFDNITKYMNNTFTNMQAQITVAIDQMEIVPIGTVIAFWGNSAPNKYLVCNGSTYSTSSYPKLYSFLGTNRVPDLRGCFLRGMGDRASSLGIRQEDASRNLTGEFATEAFVAGATGTPELTGVFDYKQDITRRHIASLTDPSNHIITFDASRVWGSTHIATEFRPINYAISWCIKAN
jgi:hypothetical protein